MNIPDDMDTGEMDMDGTGLNGGSRGNFIARLILYAHRSMLGVVKKCKGKMVLRSAPM